MPRSTASSRASQHNYLALSGFELYGTVFRKPSRAWRCTALHPPRRSASAALTLAAASDEPKPISDATGWDPLRRSAFLDIDAASGGAAASAQLRALTKTRPPAVRARAATVTNRGSADKWQMARTVQSAAPTGVVRAARGAAAVSMALPDGRVAAAQARFSVRILRDAPTTNTVRGARTRARRRL